MSDKLIIIIGIVSLIVFIILTKLFIYNKWINRIINIALFISLFILPDSLACFSLLLLILRGICWLFGPAQDMMDDYYYARYRCAEDRYNSKRNNRKDQNEKKKNVNIVKAKLMKKQRFVQYAKNHKKNKVVSFIFKLLIVWLLISGLIMGGLYAVHHLDFSLYFIRAFII